MKRFVEGVARGQSTLLPECLADDILVNAEAFRGAIIKGKCKLVEIALVAEAQPERDLVLLMTAGQSACLREA